MYDPGRQTRQRVKAWREALSRQVSVPVLPVAFEGFTTFDRLTPEDAEARPRTPFPPGSVWGRCWEYGWFFADIVLPESCAGRRIVLSSGVGGEQLVVVNGQAVGSIDREHPYVVLTRAARPGERFHIAIESYAGHGARLENFGPCPPEITPLPEVPEAQCRIAPGAAAVWNEDAYQLLVDVETLARLLEVLPERSLRAMRVSEALEDFTRIVDFEQPAADRDADYRRARERLAPVLACRNGSTAPEFIILGQSHIDLGWLWPVEETYHKSARTYANQLTLMAEYPEYRFLACEPALLEMLREQSPALFDALLEAHRRGQIIPDGAFYVECDTNLPSGESLIRQLMWGKRWFREVFGAESRVAWQPDTFGFSGALPQLLKGFGIPYFASQKLLRADPEYPRFPYQNFMWEGIDGTAVQALSFFKNNAGIEPGAFHQRWETDRTQDDHIDTLLFPFGYGDGGGGATRDFLESARRLADLEGLPRSHYGTLEEYFERSRDSARRNRWMGELYLQWHRGTYTAQRRQKALMRRLQERLHDVELLVSRLPGGARGGYLPAIHDSWQALLFNQFHDIAAGVGIARTHREASEALSAQLSAMDALEDALIRRIYAVEPAEGAYTAWNGLPWPVSRFVDLPDGGSLYARLNASGATVLDPAAPQPDDVRARDEGGAIVLENALLCVKIDGRGRVISLIDRRTGLDCLDAGQAMNEWRLYRDVECVYDAWELSHDYAETPWEGEWDVRASLTLNTPRRAEVTVTRRFSHSRATQIVRLEAASGRLEFRSVIDWRETHMLLKADFETNVLCRDAIHEIQFGNIRRPAHRSSPADRAQYEVCQQRYTALTDGARGVALLNDGSYGVSCDRGLMSLTLLKAPVVPDPACDRGEHRMGFAIMPFSGSLEAGGVVRAGYEFNQPPRILSGRGQDQTGPWAEGAILETVKPAEDGRGVILRLYEPEGRTSRAVLRLPKDAALTECGLSETESGEAQTGRDFPLTFKPFQIRTFRAVAME